MCRYVWPGCAEAPLFGRVVLCAPARRGTPNRARSRDQTQGGDEWIHPRDSRRYGADTQVLMGAFFEIVLVMALIGTAVARYPIVKRQNVGVALCYVRGRLLEAAASSSASYRS
jgi:hypothetical protein